MTIYDLLKNSSPSMAKHFKDTDNGIKELETRVTTLEDGSSGKDSSHDLIMRYIGTGTTGYEGTVDISKISNFVNALTSGDLTLTLVKDNHYIRDSLINYSTFAKDTGSFYKQLQFDDHMIVKISCNNVYADNAKLSLQWSAIE